MGPKAALYTLREFLQSGRTCNAFHLAKKAVIGIYPNEVFQEQVWPPHRMSGQIVPD